MISLLDALLHAPTPMRRWKEPIEKPRLSDRPRPQAQAMKDKRAKRFARTHAHILSGLSQGLSLRAIAAGTVF